MKKWIIGSLVGAIIIFAWQAASWMLLGTHAGEEKYTPAQDQILSVLAASDLQDGRYMLPTVKPGATMAEQQNLMKQNEGKPWAWVLYSKSMSISMTTPMIMGFVIDLILVVLLISILVRGGLPSFMGIFTGAVAVGIFTFLWGLCGLWLAWWLRRPVN